MTIPAGKVRRFGSPEGERKTAFFSCHSPLGNILGKDIPKTTKKFEKLIPFTGKWRKNQPFVNKKQVFCLVGVF